MAVVVVALDRRILDRAVHSLDLTIRPRMPRLGQAMVHIVLSTGVLEGMCPHRLSTLKGFLDERGRRCRVAGCREVDAVVGKYRVDLVGDGVDEVTEKVACYARCDLLVQLDKGELGRAVDRNKQVEPALLGPDLGDVDVEVADWVALEFAPVGLVTFDIG